MTNKKMRNKTAKKLRNLFELNFVLAHRLCKEYQKHIGRAPEDPKEVLGLLVAVDALKVIDTAYTDNSWWSQGYNDNNTISHILEDKNGNTFYVSDYLPGIWGIDWGLSDLEHLLKK